jgi:hypothetical protein
MDDNAHLPGLIGISSLSVFSQRGRLPILRLPKFVESDQDQACATTAQVKQSGHDHRAAMTRIWENVRMRLGLAVLLFSVRLLACSCAGPAGTPCLGAGMSTAVFTGKVLEIADPPPPVLVPSSDNSGRKYASRRTAAPITPHRPLRIVRLSVGDVLAGVDGSQKKIEILTGYGSGDCGYQFQVGTEYVVYAYKNSAGRLETGICTRTRPLAEAAEDVKYIHEMSIALNTGELRVHTAFLGIPGQRGATIIAERQGQRDAVVANNVGEAVFSGLRPGEYSIHVASDGDLPDDPKVQLHDKGCLDVSLFRALRITGHVMTKSGARLHRAFRCSFGLPTTSSVMEA